MPFAQSRCSTCATIARKLLLQSICSVRDQGIPNGLMTHRRRRLKHAHGLAPSVGFRSQQRFLWNILDSTQHTRMRPSSLLCAESTSVERGNSALTPNDQLVATSKITSVRLVYIALKTVNHAPLQPRWLKIEHWRPKLLSFAYQSRIILRLHGLAFPESATLALQSAACG